MKTIAFAPLSDADIPAAAALSAAEGWPHRLEDWALLLSLGHGIGAFDGNRLVGTAIAADFGTVATACMIIVAPEARGRGLGRSVMERALARLSPDEWRLIATEDGLPLYRKLGFTGDDRIVQQQGIAIAAPAEGARWATPDDLPTIAALDRAATGADRAALLARLPRLAILDDRSGYAALRPFGRGEVAGPVVAASADGARRLLGLLLTEAAGRFLRIDTPEAGGLVPWLADHGLVPVGGGIAMSRGTPAPTDPTPTVHALAAQALG